MEGLSFREYVPLKHGCILTLLTLPDLLDGHESHTHAALEILAPTGIPVLKLFRDYLRFNPKT